MPLIPVALYARFTYREYNISNFKLLYHEKIILFVIGLFFSFVRVL
ncbi:hypothetical protein Echvi_0945 [Echinicola vietnamensis DSM 17526]|uniref:Uncharacterized protein n=1 Tax=Echinicola vietnamensis (strain DSM 17526 / LMG 23754 / KMM 6221) TaxID=926556 RepID=L0FW05_ECHVK|nr:hypothetical protein Echvi_0945 [Echinicola vietnamensis DSM 17526]